jgi:hypothetical protein
MGQLDLLNNSDPSDSWPDHARFPYTANGRNVGEVVKADLVAAPEPYIVAGYASLGQIVWLLGERFRSHETLVHLRILLGSEPTPGRFERVELIATPLETELVDFWLQQGLSLRQVPELIAALQLLSTRKVDCRVATGSRMMHAKIFVGKGVLTTGSSNFSESGLYSNHEMNVRLNTSDDLFEGARNIAERFWELGNPFNLTELLERLLKQVTWQEGIARAAAELLEGEWAERYLHNGRLAEDVQLWPSQKVGIAQALWVLDNIGSVLVADATGSGKTKMGANLLDAVLERIWASGRMRRDVPMMVCPPSVLENWQREGRTCRHRPEVFSHGMLSAKESQSTQALEAALRRSQVLAVDEVHNFLDTKSLRTRKVLANTSDHRVLFTATPLNRNVSDIVSIINMLGADNFEPRVIELLKPLWSDPLHELTEDGRTVLRKEIQRFTVRRTKTLLNDMVDQEPEAYLNALGNPCRYPIHESRIYDLDESAEDITLAERIGELANELIGMIWFEKELRLPAWQERLHQIPLIEREQSCLERRLSSARALARHLVMSHLRSSRAALVEHLEGTEKAAIFMGLERLAGKQASGNQIGKLTERAGQPPGCRFGIEVPRWLIEPEAHREACLREADLYVQMVQLARQMSSGREQAKARTIAKLLEHHRLVIAFDRHPLTLLDLERRLDALGIKAIVATGADSGKRKQVNEQFGLKSTEKGLVALCSDAMAEGISLQGASAMVLLDMPTVVRVAEQRVGRIDRMDSPHERIEVLWPRDAKAFAVRADERLVERLDMVDSLIGSNMPLPDEMRSVNAKVVDPKELIDEFEKTHLEWQEMRDAFEPVRSLVRGESAIIETSLYDAIRTSRQRIHSAVGSVHADHPWAFFAVSGQDGYAPYWVFLDGLEAPPVTDLWSVSSLLRANLPQGVEDHSPDNKFCQLLAQFLDRLASSERLLLPRRKQTALEEMQFILERYERKAAREGDVQRRHMLTKLLGFLDQRTPLATQSGRVDLAALADRWLDLIHPWWYESLMKFRRQRPMCLSDVRSALINEPIATELLFTAFNGCPVGRSLDERIAAAIIGVA